MDRVTLLGVPIDAITWKGALETLGLYLDGDVGRRVCTPNPEMLVLARRRPAFRRVLRSSDLNVPDGAGLLWAARLWGRRLPERVTGTDLADGICRLAAERGRPVYLLGGRGDVARRAAERLKRHHPRLKVAGAASGGDSHNVDPDVLSDIRESRPAVLLVAFGHGAQEEWIEANLHRFPSVRVAMGVGGAFDFIAGDVRRAPQWMRCIGLEWLYRLVLQPRRIGRILTAVAVFPALVLGERLGIIKAE